MPEAVAADAVAVMEDTTTRSAECEYAACEEAQAPSVQGAGDTAMPEAVAADVMVVTEDATNRGVENEHIACEAVPVAQAGKVGTAEGSAEDSGRSSREVANEGPQVEARRRFSFC